VSADEKEWQVASKQFEEAHEWFSGNYSSWEAAVRDSTGYAAPDILTKVLAATLRVKAGDAACERDSVAFDRVEYSVPLLACLLYCASRVSARLSVMDIGGSLGSSYWQNRRFLQHLERLRWAIVEQPHFVEAGNRLIADQVLAFYDSIGSCVVGAQPNVALLSGVIQCVERPYDLVAATLESGVHFIVVDRTPFFVENLPDRLTVERVHPSVYEGSYPAWFLNLAQFRKFIQASRFSIFEEFDSWEHWIVDGQAVQNKCLLLVR
jgi:putative methyltransferase (TIGR04325 family)